MSAGRLPEARTPRLPPLERPCRRGLGATHPPSHRPRPPRPRPHPCGPPVHLARRPLPRAPQPRLPRSQRLARLRPTRCPHLLHSSLHSSRLTLPFPAPAQHLVRQTPRAPLLPASSFADLDGRPCARRRNSRLPPPRWHFLVCSPRRLPPPTLLPIWCGLSHLIRSSSLASAPAPKTHLRRIQCAAHPRTHRAAESTRRSHAPTASLVRPCRRGLSAALPLARPPAPSAPGPPSLAATPPARRLPALRPCPPSHLRLPARDCLQAAPCPPTALLARPSPIPRPPPWPAASRLRCSACWPQALWIASASLALFSGSHGPTPAAAGRPGPGRVSDCPASSGLVPPPLRCAAERCPAPLGRTLGRPPRSPKRTTRPRKSKAPSGGPPTRGLAGSLHPLPLVRACFCCGRVAPGERGAGRPRPRGDPVAQEHPAPAKGDRDGYGRRRRRRSQRAM